MRTVICILGSLLRRTPARSLCLVCWLDLLTVEGTCDSNRATVIFVLDHTWWSEVRVVAARSLAQNVTMQGDANWFRRNQDFIAQSSIWTFLTGVQENREVINCTSCGIFQVQNAIHRWSRILSLTHMKFRWHCIKKESKNGHVKVDEGTFQFG